MAPASFVRGLLERCGARMVDWLSFVRPKVFSSVRNDDVTKGNDEITGCRFETVGQGPPDGGQGCGCREREATARLIALLAEVDERRLYLGEGCSSLFTYCTQALHLSEHAAYGRIEAARAARRFPVVLDLLSEASLTLTSVTLLAPHLTPTNHRPFWTRRGAGASGMSSTSSLAFARCRPWLRPCASFRRRSPLRSCWARR